MRLAPFFYVHGWTVFRKEPVRRCGYAKKRLKTFTAETQSFIIYCACGAINKIIFSSASLRLGGEICFFNQSNNQLPAASGTPPPCHPAT